LNKDTDRGINLHLFSAAKYRDGALNLTREGINKIEGREPFKKKKPFEKKKSFEDIIKVRENNPEFMTGKRFHKKRGNVGKKFKKSGGGKRHKKH
jgi:hypothetical protein